MSRLYVVATPIGNLRDISPRAIETLKNSDIILCEDTRTSQPLLMAYEIDTKLVSYHKFNEQTRSESIIQDMLENELTVSIITDAGTPCMSDPGSYIVDKARKNGIEVYVIPGASAITSALSVSGFYFTEFAFLGFFPRENKERKEFIEKLKNSFIHTFVFYESPKRIISTMKFIAETTPDLLVVCCNELTKKFEKYITGTAKEVFEELSGSPVAELGEYAICIQKPLNESQSIQNEMSLEAIIIDDMIKNNSSIKESTSRLRTKYSRNDLYSAGLRLKELLK